MVPRRICLLTMLLLVAGIASGCYVSEFPLDPVPKVEADPRVVGAWKCLSTNGRDDDAYTVTVDRAAGRMYAITFQESKREPEHYEAHVTSLKGIEFVNVKNPTEKQKPWVFMRYTLLRPKILLVQIVHDRLLKGVDQSPASVRNTIERERLNPALYEDVMVCIRTDEGARSGAPNP